MFNAVHVDIFISYMDKDGRVLPAESFDMFEHFVTRTCGGYTRHVDVESAWRSTKTGRARRTVARWYTVRLSAEEADGRIETVTDLVWRFFRFQPAFFELVPSQATVF